MMRGTRTTLKSVCLGGVLSVAACASDVSEQGVVPHPAELQIAAPAQPDANSACQRGTLEPDLFILPLGGPGMSNGVLKPGTYLMSSTYLQLQETDAAGSKFWELMLPIFEALDGRDGLVAVSLALSFECNTTRTLSVWRDDVSMLGFVASPAHSAAVAAISDLSRGGSIVTHWAGNEALATWESAAQKLGQETGPFY